MPSESAVDLYKTKYNDMLMALSQQIESRCMPYAKRKDGIPEYYTHERIGKARMRKRSGRVELATFDSIEYDRRRLKKDHYVCNLPIDAIDIENSEIDMTSDNVNALRYAIARQTDRIILTAAIGAVEVGKDTITTLSAASDGVLTVTATGGIDQTDLISIVRNFHGNEVGLRGSNTQPSRKGFFCTPEEVAALLNIAQLTSGDYSRRYQLEEGDMTFAVGLELVQFGDLVDDPILATASSVRDCVAMVQDAVIIGFGQPEETNVKERVDYEDVWQAKGKFSAGAVRSEGIKAQKVSTTV